MSAPNKLILQQQNVSGPVPSAILIDASYAPHCFHIHVFDTLTPLFNALCT